MTFTPGPWEIYRANDGSVLGIGDAKAGGVTDYQGGFWRSGKEKRDNIYLVAAAPELYSALEDVLGLLSGAISGTSQRSGIIAEANAALRKARGEA